MLACAALLLAWLPHPPPHRLLDKAVPIPSVHPGYKDDYYWLSDHSLLLFHRVRGLSWTVARRDVRVGVETPLPTLEALFRQTGGQPESVKVSPDDTRLIWAGIGKVIYGATTDGHQFQRWPYGKDEVGISYWLNDSDHFLRYTDVTASRLPVVLRSVKGPHGVKRLPRMDEIVPPQWVLVRPFAPDERIFTDEGQDSSPPDAHITISCFTVIGVQQTDRDVPLPLGDERNYCSDPRFLSEGDALIWTLSRPPLPKRPALLWGLLARLGWHPKPFQTVRVYVSRADGTQWRFVGDWDEPMTNIYGDDLETHPHNFRWLPGGRRLSFEHQGRLDTAPAG